MLSPNIDRWVFASISAHFDSLRSGLPMFIEGQVRDTLAMKEFIELRVDGPYRTEVSKGYWKLYVEINVLCQHTMEDDYHRMRQITGIVAAIFTDCISVYKYGPDAVVDDQSYIGMLKRLDNDKGRNNLQTSHFGQVDPVNHLEQATVESHYVMFLEE